MIHLYKGLEDAVASRGEMLIYLPPYCPHFNSIEVGFSLVKRYIIKNCNILFKDYPMECMDAAFKNCSGKNGLAINLFNHCGYRNKLQLEVEYDNEIEELD